MSVTRELADAQNNDPVLVGCRGDRERERHGVGAGAGHVAVDRHARADLKHLHDHVGGVQVVSD